jgi:phosphatidylinositol glycan class V
MRSLRRLLCVAAATRVLYVGLLFVLDAALADYDTSSHLASPDCSADWPQHAAAAPHRARGSLVVWDSVFFHRIAACGYEYEQFYAFFPGFPGAHGRLGAACEAHLC